MITFSSAAFAEGEKRLTLIESTLIEIDGSTNISKFKLTFRGDDFPQSSYVLPVTLSGNTMSLGRSRLSLEVKKFKSSNPIAQSGFYKLMKANEFPQMSIEPVSIDLFPGYSSTSAKGLAKVKITITGNTREYSIPFAYSSENGIQTATGKLRMTIRDFGLVPPTEMMGMVKTSEWIEIYLKLDFKIQ
jgi:hypothetical protein